MTAVRDRPAAEVLAARTRRSFIAAGLGLGAALLGCGDDSDEAARSQAQEPVRMTHKYGTTTIPAAPKRIVAAGFNDADYVLALGLKPVGVANFIGPFREQQRSWAEEQLAGTDPPLVSNSDGELRFERIAALDPDVIVFYSYLEEGDYKRLAAIAPTVVEPKDGTLWQQHALDVGRALGRDPQARRLVRDVRERFASEREAHPEFAGRTASILFGFTGGPNVFLLEPNDPRSGLFESLGMKMPSRTGEISRELVQLLGSSRSRSLQRGRQHGHGDVERGG